MFVFRTLYPEPSTTFAPEPTTTVLEDESQTEEERLQPLLTCPDCECDCKGRDVTDEVTFINGHQSTNVSPFGNNGKQNLVCHLET